VLGQEADATKQRRYDCPTAGVVNTASTPNCGLAVRGRPFVSGPRVSARNRFELARPKCGNGRADLGVSDRIIPAQKNWAHTDKI
jgi:hypothetical protein